MFTLAPTTVIRPEPDGALMFQQETAETALLDRRGLEALYFLLKGELREWPIFFVRYLEEQRFIEEKRFIVPGPADVALKELEWVLDAVPRTVAPPRSLAVPETIHFSVTGRCDQACAGCFYSARPGSDVPAQDAGLDLFQKVVQEAGEARVFQIALGGGEPLLHPHIVDMVRLAREHNLVPNLTTNGNLLGRDLAAALKEAGLGQVQVSLNGATEVTNRRTRPNYPHALQAIEVCREVGLQFGINFLITRSSLDELEAVVSLGRQLGAATVNLLRPKPPTTEGDWLERESLDADGYRVVRKALRQLSHRSQRVSEYPVAGVIASGAKQSPPSIGDCFVAKSAPRSDISTGPRLEVDTLANSQTRSQAASRRSSWHLDSTTKITLDASLTFLLTGGPPEQLYRGGIWGCCAARKFVTVLQDGSVLPCSHVRWSDVGDGDFLRAWHESRIFRRFRELEDHMRGPCATCRYVELCRGCPAVVMASGGDFADSDPHCPIRP